MKETRLTRTLRAMPLGMGAGLFAARDLRQLAPAMPARSDLEAMRGDWRKIGADFRGAVQKLEAEFARAR